MDSKILNLFSFLNSKENRYSNDVIKSLSTLDEFKLFKTIPNDTLDLLICKYSFDYNNEEIVEYLKSIGGSDELYKNVKKWLDKTFGNLKSYTTEQYPDSTFYGYSNDNVFLEDDSLYSTIRIRYDIYLDFYNQFGEYLYLPNNVLSILYIYFKQCLELEGDEITIEKVKFFDTLKF